MPKKTTSINPTPLPIPFPMYESPNISKIDEMAILTGKPINATTTI